jgi:hypothetical protein
MVARGCPDVLVSLFKQVRKQKSNPNLISDFVPKENFLIHGGTFDRQMQSRAIQAILCGIDCPAIRFRCSTLFVVQRIFEGKLR